MKFKVNKYVLNSCITDLILAILLFSFFIFLNTIVDKANWSVDQFVLGAVSGTIMVSIYSIAGQINSLFINLSNALNGILLPKMSKMIATDNNSKILTNEFIKVGRLQQFIIFLMASGFVIFGKEFIIFWAGEEYKNSYYVGLLLILPVCIPLIQNLGLSIMQAMNKYRFKAISTTIMAIINIFISVILSKKYGAIGAAMGTSISLIICNIIIINNYYYKTIKLDIIKFWKEIIKMTIPLFIPILFILFIINIIKFYSIIKIIILGFIYILIYFITAYALCMNKYEKDLIDGCLIKIGIKKGNKESI